MNKRLEHDSMGDVWVPENAYWGAQTQRSLENFKISHEKIPIEIIQAFAILKAAAAKANQLMGRLDEERSELIQSICHEIIKGQLNQHFPLSVWQTGSGTQSNMNVNEVIANRGNERARQKLLHPNDHVNMSQSSNDTFPTAMHIAAVIQLEDSLLPVISRFIEQLKQLELVHAGIIKSGRTHLQDAVPIMFSQEISGWRGMLENSRKQIMLSIKGLKHLALGATAVGTGLNAPKGFDVETATQISKLTGKTFYTAANKFHALTSKDDLVFAHGALKGLGANLMKIANDIRWLSSGPRCGLGEITIPENEPGSSIMPGKVNPTQCEAITMIAVQVIANDTAIAIAASQGNFELNVFMPVIIHNFLQSVRLLSDGMQSFLIHCVQGIKANTEKMRYYVDHSLMLVTILTPHIGYDKAAMCAKKAFHDGLSLKEAVIQSGYLSATAYDELVQPERMV